LTI
jgi:hypothetical protein